MTEYQVEVIKYRLTKLFLLIVASLFSGGITAKSLIFHGGDNRGGRYNHCNWDEGRNFWG